MYILSWAWPSPGIDPRTPTVSGWSGGLQTSIVAHSSRESSSARSLASGVCARGCANVASAGAGASAAATLRPATNHLDDEPMR